MQYFTVTALSNPSSTSATADSGSQITVSWTKWNSKNVMVVRSTDASFTAPTGGTSYAVDATIGGDTVIYNGSGTSVADTGLSTGTTYYYKLYSVNNDYYSAGDEVNATTSASTPSITIDSTTSATAADFTTTYGTASSAQTFSIAGGNLTASITATAGTGFEVSSDGSSYSSTATFTESSGSASGTLYVRLAATASAGTTFTSATAATLSSTGATSRTISTDASGSAVSKKSLTITANSTSIIYGNPATDITSTGPGYVASGFVNGDTDAVISGSVTYTTSYTQGTAAGTGGVTVTPVVTGLSATNYSFSAANGTVTVTTLDNPSMTATASSSTHEATRVDLTMTKWNERHVMIVRNTSDSFTAPTQGTSYSVNGTIGSGTVVYNSSGTTATEDDLIPGVTYYYKIYSENYSYYSAGATTVSVTTNTPKARNSSGSASPDAPSTIYLGDNGKSFSLDAWDTVTSASDTKYGRARLVVRHNNSDLSGGTAGSYTSFTNVVARTVTSGTFNQTGTWYWGIEMDYSYSGATPPRTFWYKASSASYSAMSTDGTGSSLSFTVSALNDPSGLTVTANSTTAIDLSWTKGTSGDAKDTIIVRRAGSAVATDPTQGTTYNADDSLGDGVVVYRGGDSTFQDTGLSAGTTYHYKIYAENWSYYSSGITGSTTTLPNPPVVTGETFGGTVDVAFSESVSATNSPTSYGVESGTLPAGLSLNTSTGAITGTPTAAGTGTSVTINATNSGGAGNATFTFNIAKGASTVSVTGTTSFTYSGSPQGPDTSTVTGSGGAVTYSYSGTGGTSYGPSATKPTNAGSYSVTATVAADANYESASSSPTAFTIAAEAPTVTTGSAGTPDTSSVTITGSEVTANGGASVTARGIAYGTSTSPTTANSTTSNGTGTGTFDATLSGLTSNTTYYARAYATNSAGTSYGSQVSFTTDPSVPDQVTLDRAHTPTSGGFTVAWTDLANETSYHLEHATSSDFTSSTLVTGISANATTRTLTGLTAGTTYYVRVRGVNADGNGTWSDTQVNQLQSLANNSTKYLSAAGEVDAYTVAGIFGSANEAGLAASTIATGATTIMLLNDSGSTAHTIFYNSSAGQWREGATNKGSTSIPEGTAFVLKNNSGSTDYFLLAATPRTAPITVSVNATAGQVNLLTPAKSVPVALNALELTTGGNNTSTGIKQATLAREADVIMIEDDSGRFKPYHYDGTNWKINRTIVNGTTVPMPSVPAGGAFFIRKAAGSNFNSYTPPEDE